MPQTMLEGFVAVDLNAAAKAIGLFGYSRVLARAAGEGIHISLRRKFLSSSRLLFPQRIQ